MKAIISIRAWQACALLLVLMAGCVQAPVGSTSVDTPAAPTSTRLPPTAPGMPQPSPPIVATPQSSSGKPLQTSVPDLKSSSNCIPLGESSLLLRWSEQAGQLLLTPIDPRSGLPVCEYEPIGVGWSPTWAYQSDGSRLATVVYPRDDGRDGELRWIDLRSWQVQKTSLKFDSWVSPLTFNPDGTRLAYVAAGPPQGEHGMPSKYILNIIEVFSERRVSERELDFFPRLLEYSLDGSNLVVYGSPAGPDALISGDPRVLLLDATTLETRWEISFPGLLDGQMEQPATPDEPEFTWLSPGVDHSPEYQRLYIVHAGEERLTTVDFERHTTTTLEIQPKLVWVERLLALTAGVAHAKVLDGTSKAAVVSPDGERLFVTGSVYDSWKDENGDWQFKETGLGLQVIEVASGLELARLNSDGMQLALSADGSRLYMHGWKENSSWTDVIDTASLETVAHLPKLELEPTTRLDGSEILLSSAYRNSSGLVDLALIDPETLSPLHEWSAVNASWLDFP